MDVINLEGVTLRVNSKLAAEIGLNESIVLLQIEWWIRHSKNVRDGRRWTYQSTPDMREKAFPFWGESTIDRAVRNLKKRKLIDVGNYNRHRYDKTRWFALNPEGIAGLKSVTMAIPEAEESEASGQNDGSIPQDDGSIPQDGLSNSQFGETIPENPQSLLSRNKLIKFPHSREEDSFSDGGDSDKSDKSIPEKEKNDKGSDAMAYCVDRWGQDAVDRAIVKAQKYNIHTTLGGYVLKILRNAEAKGEIGVHSNPLVRSMDKALTPQSPLPRARELKDVAPEREKSTEQESGWGKDRLMAGLKRHFDSRSQPEQCEKSAEERAWEWAYGQLELQLDRGNFDTWVRDVLYIGACDGVYTLQAKNTYARDMLQHRLYRNVRRVLSDVLGGAEVELRFVVDGEAVAS